MTVASGPRLLDAASLLTQVVDELVVRTVRDTHLAWTDRVHTVLAPPARGPAHVSLRVHRGIAAGVYGGLGLGLRAASSGLGTLAAREVGPPLEQSPRGRLVSAVANGLIGDRLERERPRLAVPLAVRRDGRDVELERAALAAAHPGATSRVAVLLHGLSENEEAFDRGRVELGRTYADTLVDLGWTPVLLRANTGLAVRANGVALALLLQGLVDRWPVAVEQVALVGHSMGGLILRAACAVGTDEDRPWTDRVTHLVTLGTPHLGAPLAGGVGSGARALARLPETAAFGRILDQRSVGVHDLVEGLADDVPPLPHARYHLVSATLSRSPRHPVGRFLGDLLVRQPSAYGRSRRHPGLFPGADELHLPRAGHFDLLNHPAVHAALRDWLG
ncbi:lipase family alpha/beta hydrolase [Nocardioides cynanchi]|uniref:lipase family alpha/beta hydrolase n=1 Tax=Nocardioides cynanchi TaxID=2558918 RepID=UPI001247569F|nr:alpha/beta hydrolase [Nocardioides cynanchi]